MKSDDPRFIEESFPIKRVGQLAAKEKSIRHGHISTLHIWWARRPLAASRPTAYAALIAAVPPGSREWHDARNFIESLSKWENSLDPLILNQARKAIYKAHADRLSQAVGRKVTVEEIEAGHYPPPRILDPFSGGGSYPLEAMRLGCESYANDYNPVAVLILKATLEYPQRYRRPFEGMPSHLRPDPPTRLWKGTETPAPAFNPLLKAVEFWGDWVLEEARQALSDYYPSADEEEQVIGYLWARTLPCQNPACGVEIPLMRQFWLARKPPKREIALHPLSDGPGQPIRFEIVARGQAIHSEEGYAPWPAAFDPKAGTVRRAVVTCPACGTTLPAEETRRLFRAGKGGQRMVAVVTTRKKKRGKIYRLPTQADLDAYRRAEADLPALESRLRPLWGIEPVPDEPTPYGKGRGAERAFTIRNYGMDHWGDLFNPRQKLAILTFTHAVRRAHAKMRERGYPPDFAKAVTTYLGTLLSRLADYNSSLCLWAAQGEFIAHTFGRQALPMVWDYFELYPDSHATGDWNSALNWTSLVLQHLEHIPSAPPATVTHASATDIPYPSESFDAILTDPPYYDNVPYAYLSDFFYVWLKRSLGPLYPELFTTPLTPKRAEIVAYGNGEGGFEAGKHRFEAQLGQAFREMHRLLKPGGIAVIVYAHRSTAGWETVINALLKSGLVVSAAWPLRTEMTARLRANDSAALASSIYLVARKVAREPVGWYHEVRRELRQMLDEKLTLLWKEGLSGADFFIAAIGAGIAVFGQYEEIRDMTGKVITTEALLREVRTQATDFAVHQVLHNGFGEQLDSLARFYLLWRWGYGHARLEFDEAHKLAQSCGLDLSESWSKAGGFVRKEKGYVRLLGPERRDIHALAESRHIIDVLHHVLLLWERGDRETLIHRLAESGFGSHELFYRLAQAIAECMPPTSREKRLLEGMLTGRDRLQEKVKEAEKHLPPPPPSPRQLRFQEIERYSEQEER